MTDARAELEEGHAPLVSQRERARITSGLRMSIALITMVALIVAGLTGLIFLLVSRVFDSLTPTLARDLEWKARRGAIELSKTADFGILVGDDNVVRQAASDYVQSKDFVNVVAIDQQGKLVFTSGDRVDDIRRIMKEREAHTVHTLGARLVSWSPAVIEGGEIGRVAVAVSTSRLTAGDALRRQITWTARAGGLVAMLLALGFVALYIWPVLRLTQHAFVRLEHTTEQALAAARIKAQFLANMSHEIRTPMNAVVGLSKLMLGLPLSDKLRRYAEMIEVSSRSLLSIINDVLDFSKIEAGKYQIVPVPCDLTLIVQEVTELLASRADEKGVDLVHRITPAVPRIVELDADRVRQVLMNLVGNAIKFTERGEVYVLVDARPLDEGRVEVEVSVHDTGPGVAEDLRAHIFEAFSQGDSSLIRKHGGTGLGLTICKELVRLMSGTIRVESELGKGSVFSFVLPGRVLDASSALRTPVTSLGRRALIACENQHARASLAEHVVAWGMDVTLAASPGEARSALQRAAEGGQPIEVAIVAETQSGAPGAEIVLALQASGQSSPPPIVLLSQARPQAPAEGLPPVHAKLTQPVRMSRLYECVAEALQPGARRKIDRAPRLVTHDYRGIRVLVVDDNHMNQFVAAEQLAQFGFSVDQALDGQQAVEAVAKQDYALVFMDCQMPVLDGYSATRQIREREQGKHTVIIALTAHALEGERDRVFASGMDDYLTKPMRPETLQRTLERWIPGAPEAPLPPPTADLPADVGMSAASSALLQLFLEQVPMQVEQLDGALAIGEFELARAQAHKLKGSLLTMAAGELADSAQAAQHAIERGDIAAAEAQIARLVEGVVQLEARVRSELAARQRPRAAGTHA